MRVTSYVAALALILAACGGEKKEGAAPATTDTTSAAPAATPAAGGEAAAPAQTVEMTMVNGQPRFVPADITVKPGQSIKFVNKQGGPHDVMFFADSIPSGGASAITISDQMAPLTSSMVVEQDGAITVSFAPNAPDGDYKFTCQPHQMMGMHGKVTVKK